MMEIKKLPILLIISICCCICNGGIKNSFVYSKINKLAVDHYEIILFGNKIDSICILQVTDLHLGSDWEKDMIVTRRVRTMVKDEQPDIILVTGDLFTGEKDRRSYVFPFAADCFESLEIPWLFVFGNHDPEGKIGREPIRKLFDSTRWGIVGFHPASMGTVKHDYLVDLKLKSGGNTVWQIFAFDSGSEPGHKSINQDQLLWFKNKSAASKRANKKVIPGISIFHIPLKQYASLWNEVSLPKKGFLNENVCFENDDGFAYNVFLKQGNIFACFCGHDHDNNFWGKYHGNILLVYGHVTGETCYHRHWPPGGKIIRLPVNGGDIGIRDIISFSE